MLDSTGVDKNEEVQRGRMKFTLVESRGMKLLKLITEIAVKFPEISPAI